MEYDFLSVDKHKIGYIMERIMNELNQFAECSIPISKKSKNMFYTFLLDEYTTLNLKLFPIFPDPPQVYDYQVPIFVVCLDKCIDKFWDLSMRRVVPKIDGINSGKQSIKFKQDLCCS